jgi:uncharacterized Zn finger protein
MVPAELERRALERAKAERVRLVKLAGEQRYLARSRTVEPGAYFELTVSPWGQVRCACPGFTYRGICKHAAALKARLYPPASPGDPEPEDGLRVFRPKPDVEGGL